ncbi:acyltransferase family protein [Sphingobacterium sp. SGR-19]|uniref:acyltransferase family protein n=1 Tax=Sphingobacterium sp. SGR-19 TaxID=2710886 RepID=UPI0013EC7AE4|nr:acyltransferase [Sphingobacterium sp. SGR-19]NGM64061.1 acyltransferase [Sphingobacterium sp. SGR-19]
MEYLQAEKRLSSVIESMRFPLIYLVVIAHMVSFDTPRITLSWDSNDIYTFVSEMISHNLARLSVRCYFLISGYYLFKKLVEWNSKAYTGQLKKKIRTLLLPYVLWNLILVGAIVAKYYLFNKLGLNVANSEVEYATIRDYSWYELLWGMPINFPLWYMRDLICMTLIAPLFYYWFAYLKHYGLILFVPFYLLVHNTGAPGFSSTAVMFFGAGAYFALYKQNLLLITAPFKKISMVLALMLLLVSTMMNGTIYHEYIVRIFILVGVVAVINLFDVLNNNERLRTTLAKLAPTSFFIYVAHEVYIINWLKGGWARLPFSESGWGKLIGYFVVPCLCILVCIGLYYLIKAISPKLLGLLTGGRMSCFVYKEGEIR